MNGKYYMVRHNQESLLGPHNLPEISNLYRNKQCSINDEISGNTGPWVYLRNREELKKHYPEIVSIFHRTAAPKENLVSAYEKYIPKPHKNSSSLLTSMLVVIVLLGVATASYYLYYRHQKNTLCRVSCSIIAMVITLVQWRFCVRMPRWSTSSVLRYPPPPSGCLCSGLLLFGTTTSLSLRYWQQSGNSRLSKPPLTVVVLAGARFGGAV